jgi:hypothetical protein
MCLWIDLFLDFILQLYGTAVFATTIHIKTNWKKRSFWGFVERGKCKNTFFHLEAENKKTDKCECLYEQQHLEANIPRFARSDKRTKKKISKSVIDIYCRINFTHSEYLCTTRKSFIWVCLLLLEFVFLVQNVAEICCINFEMIFEKFQ